MARLSSSKPGKQRKSAFQRKLHEQKKSVSVHLNKELRKTIGKRAVPVRKEDSVAIVRGKYKGKKGKVVEVNRKKGRIFVSDITRKKAGGKEVFVPIQPSNLEVTDLYSKDKFRFSEEKSGAGVMKEKGKTQSTVKPKVPEVKK